MGAASFHGESSMLSKLLGPMGLIIAFACLGCEQRPVKPLPRTPSANETNRTESPKNATLPTRKSALAQKPPEREEVMRRLTTDGIEAPELLTLLKAD